MCVCGQFWGVSSILSPFVPGEVLRFECKCFYLLSHLNWLLHFFILFYGYGCFVCMCVCVPHVCGPCWGQKRVLGPLELKLQCVCCCVGCGTWPWVLWKTLSSLQCWAMSSAPQLTLYKKKNHLLFVSVMYEDALVHSGTYACVYEYTWRPMSCGFGVHWFPREPPSSALPALASWEHSSVSAFLT